MWTLLATVSTLEASLQLSGRLFKAVLGMKVDNPGPCFILGRGMVLLLLVLVQLLRVLVQLLLVLLPTKLLNCWLSAAVATRIAAPKLYTNATEGCTT